MLGGALHRPQEGPQRVGGRTASSARAPRRPTSIHGPLQIPPSRLVDRAPSYASLLFLSEASGGRRRASTAFSAAHGSRAVLCPAPLLPASESWPDVPFHEGVFHRLWGCLSTCFSTGQNASCAAFPFFPTTACPHALIHRLSPLFRGRDRCVCAGGEPSAGALDPAKLLTLSRAVRSVARLVGDSGKDCQAPSDPRAPDTP